MDKVVLGARYYRSDLAILEFRRLEFSTELYLEI